MRAVGSVLSVNNAGDMVRRARIEELSDAELERVIDLSLTAVVSACRQVLPAITP